jgi:hypothetical protein
MVIGTMVISSTLSLEPSALGTPNTRTHREEKFVDSSGWSPRRSSRQISCEKWRESHGILGYPLVIWHNIMENHHFYMGKPIYKWAIFHSYVSLPEGKKLVCSIKLRTSDHEITWKSRDGTPSRRRRDWSLLPTRVVSSRRPVVFWVPLEASNVWRMGKYWDTLW